MLTRPQPNLRYGLVIAAVGGALILPVSTSDPTICDPGNTFPGPTIDIPASSISNAAPMTTSREVAVKISGIPDPAAT